MIGCYRIALEAKYLRPFWQKQSPTRQVFLLADMYFVPIKIRDPTALKARYLRT